MFTSGHAVADSALCWVWRVAVQLVIHSGVPARVWQLTPAVVLYVCGCKVRSGSEIPSAVCTVPCMHGIVGCAGCRAALSVVVGCDNRRVSAQQRIIIIFLQRQPHHHVQTCNINQSGIVLCMCVSVGVTCTLQMIYLPTDITSTVAGPAPAIAVIMDLCRSRAHTRRDERRRKSASHRST